MTTKIAMEMLTYDEACSRLKIAKRTLLRMLGRGLFGRARIGRLSCVFSDEIEVYIDGLARGNGEAAVRAYRVKCGRIKR